MQQIVIQNSLKLTPGSPQDGPQAIAIAAGAWLHGWGAVILPAGLPTTLGAAGGSALLSEPCGWHMTSLHQSEARALRREGRGKERITPNPSCVCTRREAQVLARMWNPPNICSHFQKSIKVASQCRRKLEEKINHRSHL